MTVVDIRNVVTDSNVELIEISDSTIYYAEEKVEEGHHNLFLLEYDRETKTERILTNVFLSDPTLVLHFFSFQNDILAVMEGGGSFLKLLRVDKRSGEEKNQEEIHFIGDFAGCKALDESRVIFYTNENEEHRNLFREYRGLTGFDHVTYVYDLDERRYYYVKDGRICGLLAENLITFDLNGQPQLLAMQAYGSEEEKLLCYGEQKWMGSAIDDNVWLCPLIDFLVAVKTAESHLPLERIFSIGTEGMVRYLGMDEQSIYFKAGYFPHHDTRICAVDKASGKKRIIASLNLTEEEQNVRFIFDAASAQGYRLTELADSLRIDGVLNSQVHGEFSQDLGDFAACIQDRYLVARYVLEDETDRFTFHSIYDLETKQQQSYECRCAIHGDTVVLY